MLKTALVTGASRGIGAAVAKGLAADGYQVAGVYCYSRDAMEELAAACGVIPIAADLSQTDALPELAETVLEHLGHVDVLVNNAACSYINLFQCLPPEQVRRLYAVNLTAPVELSRLLLPSMLSRHAGCIVNISSMWGDSGVYPCTGERSRSLRHSRQCRFAGDDRYGYGVPPAAGNTGRTGRGNTAGTAGETGRCGRCRAVSGVRTGGVYHRTGYSCKRRFLVRLTGGRGSVDFHPNTGNLPSATCTKPFFGE